MRLRFIFLGVGIFLLSAATMVRATYLPTNMDLVMETIEQAVDQALADMKFPADGPREEPLLIEAQAEHQANWLVDHILAERLLGRGFAVTLDSAGVQPGSIRLSYRILDLGVTGQSGLWRGQVHRQSRATLALRLSGADGETLYWQDEQTVLNTDRIPKGKVELLQTTGHDFARTDLEEQSWGRFVEPAIVSTVLGGLVYLFFSNR